MATIIIPFPLRQHTENQREVVIPGQDLAAVMTGLLERHPGLEVVERQPGLLSLFINGRAVTEPPERWSQVAVVPEDEISLIIPIAGG